MAVSGIELCRHRGNRRRADPDGGDTGPVRAAGVERAQRRGGADRFCAAATGRLARCAGSLRRTTVTDIGYSAPRNAHEHSFYRIFVSCAIQFLVILRNIRVIFYDISN